MWGRALSNWKRSLNNFIARHLHTIRDCLMFSFWLMLDLDTFGQIFLLDSYLFPNIGVVKQMLKSIRSYELRDTCFETVGNPRHRHWSHLPEWLCFSPASLFVSVLSGDSRINYSNLIANVIYRRSRLHCFFWLLSCWSSVDHVTFNLASSMAMHVPREVVVAGSIPEKEESPLSRRKSNRYLV